MSEANAKRDGTPEHSVVQCRSDPTRSEIPVRSESALRLRRLWMCKRGFGPDEIDRYNQLAPPVDPNEEYRECWATIHLMRILRRRNFDPASNTK